MHPLDPLSKDELEVVVATLKSQLDLGHQHLIAMVQVEEPSKAELASSNRVNLFSEQHE